MGGVWAGSVRLGTIMMGAVGGGRSSWRRGGRSGLRIRWACGGRRRGSDGGNCGVLCRP